jgi:predicted NUDIX family NTP pyrophosphohydrolase
MDHKPRLIVAEDDPLIAWAVKVGLADGADGMAAAREISSRLGIPVVMCSEDAGTDKSRDGAGVVGWVSRPYRISDLNRLIAAAIRH